MKAIVQNRYGSADVFELREVDEPVTGDDQLLVRVRAASVHADVWHVMRGVPYVLRIMGAGFRRPKNLVPGTDLAGRVESVGRKVRRFQPGDEVFGQSFELRKTLTGELGVLGARVIVAGGPPKGSRWSSTRSSREASPPRSTSTPVRTSSPSCRVRATSRTRPVPSSWLASHRVQRSPPGEVQRPFTERPQA